MMKTKTVAAMALTEPEKQSMYQIMQRYYNNVSREQFEIDLYEKTDVILLLNAVGTIVGFSTLLNKKMKIAGRDILALYSGDTVLDRAYWGNGTLGLAFGAYLTKAKLQNPFLPVYWFLISKGYKTYLLMANNFPLHYPRFEKPTPQKIQIFIDHFYTNKFGASYNSEKGLIQPQEISSSLKTTVADIDSDLLKHPRIHFFARQNPGWIYGQELTCIAEVTLWVPLRYTLKRIYKIIFSKIPARLKKNALVSITDSQPL